MAEVEKISDKKKTIAETLQKILPRTEMSTKYFSRRSKSFPPQPFDIDKYLDDVISSGKLNGRSATLSEKLEKLGEIDWAPKTQQRYAKAAALADILATENAKKCGSGGKGSGSSYCWALQAVPEVERSAVLASVILAPEAKYRAVVDLFDKDADLLSALFEMPLSAANLRVQYDQLSSDEK